MRRPNWLAVFMLVSSLTLLYFGIPRFLAELMLVPGTPIIERIKKGETVSEKDMAVAIESREQAVSFVDHPKAYYELGTAYFMKSRQASDPALKKAEAQTAIKYLEHSLSLMQLNTFAWSRLALSRMTLGGDENRIKAVEAWRMAVKTAPFEPDLLLTRLHIGINLYKYMDESDHQLMRDQAAMTYRWNKGKFRRYMRNKKLIEWAVFLLHGNVEAIEYMKK